MMDKQKLISVIMSTYNECEDHLKASIESILNQTYDNIEFIIILDNPQNHMHLKVIEGYAKKDNRIKFIKNDSNLGLTESLNRGLKYTQGTYIARMDADDIALKDRLECQVQYLLEYNLDIVGGGISKIDECGNLLYPYKPMNSNLRSINWIMRYLNIIPHPTWVLKKEVYLNVGGYRDIHTAEDYDFLLRSIKKGFKIGILDKEILKYRLTVNGISRKFKFKQFLTTNYMTKNINKNYSTDDIKQFIDENNILQNEKLYDMTLEKVLLLSAKKNEIGLFNIAKEILHILIKEKYGKDIFKTIVAYKVFNLS